MFDLYIGTILMAISILLYLMLLRGARMPEKPIWMREGLVANLYTPLLIGTLVFGLGHLIRFTYVLVA